MNLVTANQFQPTRDLVSSASKELASLENEQPRQTAMAIVAMKQQKELIETAQKAFNPAEDPEPSTPSGEIALEAAKKQGKQTLAYEWIERIFEAPKHRPRIQEAV